MEKLYPIIKRAKTHLGRRVEEDSPYRMVLAYCPVCGKRLSTKKVDPKHGVWSGEYERLKARNGNGLAGKPTYCEKCGSLIHPLS